MTHLLYIKFVQHFIRNKLGNTHMGLVFSNLKIFMF